MEAIVPAGRPALKVPLSSGVRAGDFVYVSGQVATNPDGSFYLGDFRTEVNRTIDNVESIIVAAGGTLADVVKIGAYLSSGISFPLFNEVYAERFTGDVLPARTTAVIGFAHPDVRVEIDAVVYLPQA